jgi:uncharacterized protein
MRTPISEHHRLSSIDTLRGFALLGILVMNIQSFAMISAAYTFPNLHMDISGVNQVIWTLSHIFADLKFMAIFSMLFGAGVILATQRRDQAGKRTWTYHYARTFWLLIFGMIHAYFIWYGDILVTYALCGFVVYWFRNFSAPLLFFIGGISLLIALLIMMSAGVAPADVQQGILRDFVPHTAEIDREIAAYRGTWSDVQNARLIEVLDIQFAGIPFFLFWRAGGLMLIGMALFKLGVFSTTSSFKFYIRLLGVSGLIGFPLVAHSAVQLIGHNWDPSFSLLQHGGVYNYLGSIGVALFYVGGIMLIAKKTIWHALQTRLAAVGRMAFTNYILQSVIATGLFYGYGFGLFGAVERWGQFLIVLIIWAFQLWMSPVWLSKFRFGPLEWLWRSLTYFKFQAMLK